MAEKRKRGPTDVSMMHCVVSLRSLNNLSTVFLVIEEL